MRREDAMSQLWKWTALAGASAAVLVYVSVRQRVSMLREMMSHEDERVTEALEESFPASDPPSQTPTIGPQLAH
jgi:hypothetical protein